MADSKKLTKSIIIDNLYAKVNVDKDVDFAYIRDMLTRYSYKLDEESNNVNIFFI